MLSLLNQSQAIEDLRTTCSLDIHGKTPFNVLFWNALYENDAPMELLREYDCYKDESMLKPLAALVFDQYHIDRLEDLKKYDELRRSNIVSSNRK